MSVALLIIDMMNDFEWPGGDRLRPQAVDMAPAIVRLKERCLAEDIPCIYVNDNYGLWRSDFKTLIQHCLEAGEPVAGMTHSLLPGADDYFVLKPRHSGFFSTCLDLLLAHLGVRTLIITGLAADSCVLHTAADAHMRGYRLVVPGDCIAAEDPADRDWVLEHMQRMFGAETGLCCELIPLLPALVSESNDGVAGESARGAAPSSLGTGDDGK